MSESALSGWTCSKTIGSSSAPASGAFPARRSKWLSTALRKRHSTTGWMAVHFSLMSAWIRVFSSSMVRCTAMEKSGKTSWSFGRCVASRSPGWRFELEGADHPVLVEERRDDEVAGPALDDLVVDGGLVRHRGEVVDDERAPLVHRARIDGPLELLLRVVPGVGEDAGVLALRA